MLVLLKDLLSKLREAQHRLSSLHGGVDQAAKHWSYLALQAAKIEASYMYVQLPNVEATKGRRQKKWYFWVVEARPQLSAKKVSLFIFASIRTQ